mmetsp:Transcript_38676/g.76132  ORF Transcript_38676/g.76132 Transcript_38676/m.76132 type:complete len:440 (+) Transcript_38676:61-1380(+)
MATVRGVTVLCAAAVLFSGGAECCAHHKTIPRKAMSPARRLHSVQLHESAVWSNNLSHLGLGQVSGVDLNSKNVAYIFHRGERAWGVPDGNYWERHFRDLFDGRNVFLPQKAIQSSCLVMVDGNGNKIGEWGEYKFLLPHGITIDHHDNVWLTDVGSHLVHKFSKDHHELLTLGENRKPGNKPHQFCKPTDVAVSKRNGMVFVSDGYCNSRVVAYTPQGKYHAHYDLRAPAGGEAVLPHSLTVDSRTNDLFVADRENGRLLHVQLSRDGKRSRASVLHQLSGHEKLFALHYSPVVRNTGVISLLVQDRHGSKLQAFTYNHQQRHTRRGGRKLLLSLENEMYLHSTEEDAEDQEAQKSKLTHLKSVNSFEQSFLHDLAVKFSPVGSDGVVEAQFITGGWKWDSNANYHQVKNQVPTYVHPKVHRYAHHFDLSKAGLHNEV